MRMNRILVSLLLIALLAFFLVLSIVWKDHFLLLSFGVVSISIIFLILRFESRKVEARELVLLAVLAAIAAVGRVPFASIPSVQPTSFVILISGYVFGAESGFMIGAVAALASNMFLGQGPWTPWQMTAWGLIGLTAGLLRNTAFMNRSLGRILFGLIWGFLFGWIMNIWGFFSLTQSTGTTTLTEILAYFAGSAFFDSLHALSNAVLLLLFGNTWIKSLTRFKRKYGLII